MQRCVKIYDFKENTDRMPRKSISMVDETRLNTLQEGLNARKHLTDSQYKVLEIEMIALKRQNDSIVQQLVALTIKLQMNHQNSLVERSKLG